MLYSRCSGSVLNILHFDRFCSITLYFSSKSETQRRTSFAEPPTQSDEWLTTEQTTQESALTGEPNNQNTVESTSQSNNKPAVEPNIHRRGRKIHVNDENELSNN